MILQLVRNKNKKSKYHIDYPEVMCLAGFSIPGGEWNKQRYTSPLFVDQEETLRTGHLYTSTTGVPGESWCESDSICQACARSLVALLKEGKEPREL